MFSLWFLSKGNFFFEILNVFAKEVMFLGENKNVLNFAHEFAAAKGRKPYAVKLEAIKFAGGMGRFVKKRQ